MLPRVLLPLNIFASAGSGSYKRRSTAWGGGRQRATDVSIPTKRRALEPIRGGPRVKNGTQYHRAASCFLPSVLGRPSESISVICIVSAASISEVVLQSFLARPHHVRKAW